ncbi:MAG: FHA domain-containing protein [Planctomycetia bacterium]|nr:FHA domain-containing protein [Planctomycetia bacterium]
MLRINVGPQAGRTIRLSSPKCTIGSAPNCTLRLRGKGIEPVHCVVLHGSRQTVVRRWASDTFINDHRFEDQTLRAGDRLAIGALEFQVVSLPGSQQIPAAPVRNLELEAKLDKLLVAQLTGRLELANRQARRRLRAVIGKLRKFQMRMSELETRRRTNTHEQEQLAAEKARVEALDRDLQARFTELERKRAATAAEDQALVEQGERLRALSKQWNQDRAAAHQALDQRRAELESAAALFADDVTRLEAEQADLAERSTALTRRFAELAAREQEIAARAATLERCVGRLQDQRREIEIRSQEQNAVAEQQLDRDAELAQLAESLRSSTAAFEQRIAERERLCAERESELARRTTKLIERERNEVGRAQSQADALARQWAVIQAVSDEQQRVGSTQGNSSAELTARAATIATQEAELTKRSAALELQLAELAARAGRAADSSQELETRTAELVRREAEVLAQRNDFGRQSEQVARRCEALKQNWSELNERERRVVEREARCAAAEAAAIAPVASVEVAEVTDTKTADDGTAAQLRSDLAEREELIRSLSEQLDLLQSRASAAPAPAAVANIEVQPEIQAELETLRARDEEARAGQAAMLEAATIYESKLTELSSELAELQRGREAQKQEIARKSDECEALSREAELLREELTKREQASIAAEAAAAANAISAESAIEAPAAEETSPEDVTAEDTRAEEVATAKRIADELIAEAREQAEREARDEEATYEPEAEEASEEVAETSSTTAAAPRPAEGGESAADVLRRLGMAAVLDDDAEHAAPAAAPKKAPEPPRPVMQPARAPEPAAAGEHANEEDSLNDYMAQLMQRLGVRNDSQAAAAAAAKPEPVNNSAARPMAKPAAPKPVEEKPALAPFEPGEFKARSVAAERSSDLSALRALANANARTAITTHQIKTTHTASRWKGVVATLALSTSGIGAYFYYNDHHQGIYCMASGVIAAIAFGLQSFGLKHRAQKSTRSLDDVLSKSNAKMNAENNAADAAKTS